MTAVYALAVATISAKDLGGEAHGNVLYSKWLTVMTDNLLAADYAECSSLLEFGTMAHYGPRNIKRRSTGATTSGLKLQCIAIYSYIQKVDFSSLMGSIIWREIKNLFSQLHSDSRLHATDVRLLKP